MDDLEEKVNKYFRTRTTGQRGVVKDFVTTPNREHSIFLGDNDYLSLINHEDVVRCQVEDLQSSVSRGAVMSSVLLTDDDPHSALERDMGRWFGKGCHLAQSGYAANAGLMHAICEPGVNVYVDRALHMSFYDGLNTRRANVYPNKSNDAAHLEANIQKHGPGIIVVESVYSGSGAFAPLEEIVRIKKQYNCVLVVDESHSLGIFHPKSYIHLKGLQDDVDFVTASLAKAYATRAGVIFGSHARFTKETSFAYIFSSALVQNDIVRIRAIWEVIKTADDRRERLLEASRLLRAELSKVGKIVKVEGPLPSAIISLRVKDEDEMASLHRHLSSRGILAAPFFAPAAPLKSPIIRFSVNCDLTAADVSKVANAVAEFFGPTPRL